MPEPGYWMHETSGVLRPAIVAFLEGGAMSAEHVRTVRAYLRQWINAPCWAGDDVEHLRAGIDGLTSPAAIREWLREAYNIGIDPL